MILGTPVSQGCPALNFSPFLAKKEDGRDTVTVSTDESDKSATRRKSVRKMIEFEEMEVTSSNATEVAGISTLPDVQDGETKDEELGQKEIGDDTKEDDHDE